MIPSTEQIVDKIRVSLVASGWDQILRIGITRELPVVIDKLKESSQISGKFLPAVKDCLNWLRECPSHKVKVIIIVDIKNNIFGLANGIPLSTPLRKPSPLMQKLFTSIDKYYDKSADLTRWSNQGVLLVPLSPTWSISGKGHHSIWKNWTNYILEKIKELYSDVPVIYIGKDTWPIRKRLPNPYQRVIKLSRYKADAGDCWNQINEILKSGHMKQIDW